MEKLVTETKVSKLMEELYRDKLYLFFPPEYIFYSPTKNKIYVIDMILLVEDSENDIFIGIL